MSRPEIYRSPRGRFAIRTSRGQRKYRRRGELADRRYARGWHPTWWCYPLPTPVKPSTRRPGRRAHRRSTR